MDKAQLLRLREDFVFPSTQRQVEVGYAEDPPSMISFQKQLAWNKEPSSIPSLCCPSSICYAVANDSLRMRNNHSP